MSSSTSGEKKNSVVTLKAQACNFNFEALKAEVVRKERVGMRLTRGFTAFKYLPRMRFVINETNVRRLTPTLVAGAEQCEFNLVNFRLLFLKN